MTGVLGTLLPFLFVLTVVIFFHELGHYWVARRFGVRVEVFSIGFGRTLWSRTAKSGTDWRVSMIPLGGYVRYYGDADAASTPDLDKLNHMSVKERKESYFHQPPLARIAIAAAGPFANFALAIVLFWGLFAFIGQVTRPAEIAAITPDSAAQAAGLEIGDKIVAIDGAPAEAFGDLRRAVALSGGQEILLGIDRAGTALDIPVTPRWVERDDGAGGVIKGWLVGIAPPDKAQQRTFGVGEALQKATDETWNVISGTLGYVGRMIGGTESASGLGGPIRIADASGDAAQYGFAALLGFTALVSVSIGLVNLFPIPMLDGGHILL
ncbi:MAG: M50 family metallopeptidase, partial [Alphaproteobacteria bacterium]